jgi:hypothetical protein
MGSSRPPDRPHPLARARKVDKLASLLDRAWDKGWLPPPPEEPQELIRRASKGFELRDENGGRCAEEVADFRIRLEKLLAAIEAEAQLNAVGRIFAYGLITRAIRNRFALGALWRKQPEILETTLAPPIIVVGHMRSGTTRIHRLLAADPMLSATRFCDSWHPVPDKFNLRPLRGAFDLIMARQLDPWIDSIHPFGAARVDEELGWLANALNHATYEAQWRIPSYTAFSEQRDPQPVYRELARILRTDAAHHGNASRPRVMKVPQFSEDVAALLAQFPDARIVVSHRSSDDTFRSSVSMVANQMAIQSDHIDLAWIEQEWRRKIALRQDRMSTPLAQFSGPIATIDFDRLGADWEAEMRTLYGALGMELSPQALTAMRAEMRSSENGKHRAHAEQIKRFDTTG